MPIIEEQMPVARYGPKVLPEPREPGTRIDAAERFAAERDERDQADALVERAFADGADGLRVAFEAYGGIVHRYCSRTLDEHGARDATQETFVTAWRRRQDFDAEQGSLLAWLLGIARYSTLTQQRTLRRAPVPTDAVAVDARDAVPDPADAVADRLLVAHALTALPQRTQESISLCYLEGLTQQEAADRLGLPLGTVKSDIRRGLVRMRRALGGDDD